MKKIISILIFLTSVIAVILYLDNKNFIESKKENNNLNSSEVMAVYQKDTGDYYSVDTIPSSGYELNTTESYCLLNNERKSVSIELKDDGVYFGKILDKGTKCYLYFDKLKGKTMDSILTGYNIGSRGSYNSVYTTSTTKTIFTVSDGLGTSKYFAGAPTDNYVKFGGFYWRIIRMNGNKTTRLIYAGDASVIDGLSNKQTVLANGYNDSSTNYTQVKRSGFNETDNNNAYVGFKYAIGSLRGTTNKSTILGELDTWYETNLKTSYSKYIDGSTGFCGDRTPYTNNTGTASGGGTGTTETYYADYIRFTTFKSPVLTCANSSDLYTTSGSSRGNKALTNPIGLINANEVAMAGGVYGTQNTSYYLQTGKDYWSMSPAFFNSKNIAFGLYVNATGSITHHFLSSLFSVRPVINLASSTEYTGTGTWDDPFIPILT